MKLFTIVVLVVIGLIGNIKHVISSESICRDCSGDVEKGEEELSALETILLFPLSFVEDFKKIPPLPVPEKWWNQAFNSIYEGISTTLPIQSGMEKIANLKSAIQESTDAYIEWVNECLLAQYLYDLIQNENGTLASMQALMDSLQNLVIATMSATLYQMSVWFTDINESLVNGKLNCLPDLLRLCLIDAMGSLADISASGWQKLTGLGITTSEWVRYLVAAVLALSMLPLFGKKDRGSADFNNKRTKKSLEMHDETRAVFKQLVRNRKLNPIPELSDESLQCTCVNDKSKHHYLMCESFDHQPCNCGGRSCETSQKKFAHRPDAISNRNEDSAHYLMCEYFDSKECNCGGKKSIPVVFDRLTTVELEPKSVYLPYIAQYCKAEFIQTSPKRSLSPLLQAIDNYSPSTSSNVASGDFKELGSPTATSYKNSPASTSKSSPASTIRFSPASTGKFSPASTCKFSPASSSTGNFSPASTGHHSLISASTNSLTSTDNRSPASTNKSSPASTYKRSPASAGNSSPTSSDKSTPASTNKSSPVSVDTSPPISTGRCSPVPIGKSSSKSTNTSKNYNTNQTPPQAIVEKNNTLLDNSIDSEIGVPCCNSSFKEEYSYIRSSRWGLDNGDGPTEFTPVIISKRSPHKELGVSFQEVFSSDDYSYYEEDSLLDVSDINKSLSYNNGDGIFEFAVMFIVQSAFRLTKRFFQRRNQIVDKSFNVNMGDMKSKRQSDLFIIPPHAINNRSRFNYSSRNISGNATDESQEFISTTENNDSPVFCQQSSSKADISFSKSFRSHSEASGNFADESWSILESANLDDSMQFVFDNCDSRQIIPYDEEDDECEEKKVRGVVEHSSEEDKCVPNVGCNDNEEHIPVASNVGQCFSESETKSCTGDKSESETTGAQAVDSLIVQYIYTSDQPSDQPKQALANTSAEPTEIQKSASKEAAQPLDTVDEIQKSVSKEAAQPLDTVDEIQKSVSKEAAQPLDTVDEIQKSVSKEAAEPLDTVDEIQKSVSKEAAEPLDTVDEIQKSVSKEAAQPLDTVDEIQKSVSKEAAEPLDNVDEIQKSVSKEAAEPLDTVDEIQKSVSKEAAQPLDTVDEIQKSVSKEAAEPLDTVDEIQKSVSKEAAEPLDTVDEIQKSVSKEAAQPLDTVDEIQKSVSKEAAQPLDTVDEIQKSVSKEAAEPLDTVDEIQKSVSKEAAEPLDTVDEIQKSVSKEAAQPLDTADDAACSVIAPSFDEVDIPNYENDVLLHDVNNVGNGDDDGYLTDSTN